MKHITLRKHYTWTKSNPVYLWRISKSTGELLSKCNFMTQSWALGWIKEELKIEFPNTDFLCDYRNEEYLDKDCLDRYNKVSHYLFENDREKYKELDALERYWMDNGVWETNFEKYGDLHQHLVPRKEKYTDANDGIKDLDKEFEKYLEYERDVK